jgi:hypothetical protein
MQPWTLPRVRAWTVVGTVARTAAAVATPVVAGLAAAALVVAAPSAAVPAHAVAVMAEPGPVLGMDRNGIGLGDLTVDPRAVTSGVSDLGISDGTSTLEPVGVLGEMVGQGLATVSRVREAVAGSSAATP